QAQRGLGGRAWAGGLRAGGGRAYGNSRSGTCKVDIGDIAQYGASEAVTITTKGAASAQKRAVRAVSPAGGTPAAPKGDGPPPKRLSGIAKLSAGGLARGAVGS